MNVLSLFAGIGGFDLGLERAGMKVVAQCEIDLFCRRVLAKYWPEVPCYEDVRDLTAERLASDGIVVDGICGGFPCQDISISGVGAGLAGSRSGLWFEYVRLVGELRPKFVFVENVAELLGRGLGTVLGSLAALGYDAVWDCIPAAYAGAPIIRDRVWILAVPQRSGWQGCFEHVSALSVAAETSALRSDPFADARRALDGDLDALRPDHGLSVTMERARIGQFGNAVVPQIPEIIGRAIIAAQSERLAA